MGASLIWPAVGEAQDAPHRGGHLVDVGGRNIWVEVEGSGPPLLVIAGGGGGSHDYFHPYLDALSDSLTVIYFDGFGRGRSERVADEAAYTFAADLEDIEGLRRELGFERWAIFGHSFSVYTALGYAARWPEHVTNLILSDGMISGEDYQRSTDDINGLTRRHLPELWERVSKVRAEGHVSRDAEHQAAYLDDFVKVMELSFFWDPRQIENVVWSELTFNPVPYYALAGPDADFVVGGDIRPLDFHAFVRETSIPILVMGGRHDGVVYPALLDSFTRANPDIRPLIFEKSGHFPFMEETDAFIATVFEALR